MNFIEAALLILFSVVGLIFLINLDIKIGKIIITLIKMGYGIFSLFVFGYIMFFLFLLGLIGWIGWFLVWFYSYFCICG